ncbi:MAG: pyridine nucleotide-disulfide oxidoreductase [Rhodothermaceae bacterium]|nr:pyridine nucleotide-disulfide oxidoreductase [Rhodothermaceae bacterium]
MSPLRLLIVGGGHASLPLLGHAGRLAEAEGATVTLVSDRSELWYSGMTPEWLGGVYTQTDVTIPLAPICEREGVRFVQARAVGLDRDAREVVLADGRREPYDVVAFDIGAVNPGRADAEAAVWTKPLWRIEALGRFLDEAGGARRHLVIVGGGAAGTETALNVTARPDLHGLSVTVLEPGQRLCPELPTRVGAWAAETLRRRGATVRLGTRAEGADAGGVHLPGEVLPADAVLWATGSVGPPLFGDAGLSVTERGLARVDVGLRSVDDGRVFVAGDSASVAGREALPRIGVHAVKQGPVLRENVAQALRALGAGQDPARVPLRPFRPYPVAPLLLSTGEPSAWWIAGPVALKSRLLLRLKHAVDRRWIERYRSADTAGSRWDARHAAARG